MDVPSHGNQGDRCAIDRAFEIASAVAAAVEEQGAANQGIARKMRQAVAGAEVTSNIPGESPRGRGNPTPLLDAGRITGPARKYDLATLPACFPMAFLWELERYNKSCKLLILLVGAPRFELGTPSPPDRGGP